MQPTAASVAMCYGSDVHPLMQDHLASVHVLRLAANVVARFWPLKRTVLSVGQYAIGRHGHLDTPESGY
jgi:hypothetical protein